MNAQEWKQLISAYADDGLSLEEKAVAEQILTERREARVYLNELRKLSMNLGALKEEKLSPDAETKILSQVKRGGHMKVSYSKITIGILSVALVLVWFQDYTKRALQARVRDGSVYLTSEQDVQFQQYAKLKQQNATASIRPDMQTVASIKALCSPTVIIASARLLPLSIFGS